MQWCYVLESIKVKKVKKVKEEWIARGGKTVIISIYQSKRDSFLSVCALLWVLQNETTNTCYKNKA